MNQLQAAIFAKLSAAIGAGIVFDQVPDNRPGAYCVIGDDTATEWDTDDAPGKACTVTVHTYATNTGQAVTSTGYKDAKALAELVYNALHLQRVQVAAWESSRAVFEFEHAQRDNSGISRHVIQRFRIYLHR
jgi:hypothetical protein